MIKRKKKGINSQFDLHRLCLFIQVQRKFGFQKNDSKIRHNIDIYRKHVIYGDSGHKNI